MKFKNTYGKGTTKILPSLFLNLKEIWQHILIWYLGLGSWVTAKLFCVCFKVWLFYRQNHLITLFTWNYCITMHNKTIAIWLLSVENFCFRSKQEVVKEMPQCGEKTGGNILCTIQHFHWHSSLLVSALTFQSSNFLHTACLPLKWQQLSAPRGLDLAGVV